MQVCEHWAWRYNLFMPTKWFFPPTISFDGGEVRIQRKSLFGLMSTDERIKLDRIASVRLAQGLLTAAVVIETMGGAQTDFRMACLPKGDARRFADMVNDAV